MKTNRTVILLSLLALVASAHAKAADPQASQPGQQAPSGMSSVKPLEVQGQARGTMLLNFQNEKFEIKFIKVRKDYREEILATPY